VKDGVSAGPLVMEDDSNARLVREDARNVSAASTPAQVPKGTPLAEPMSSRSAHAGICNGVRFDCVTAKETGVRHCAQLRLNCCNVDYERLKSSARDSEAERGHNRDIRRLMRQTYGPPDQDYDDWQIVVMSDMDSGVQQPQCA
jgi:hypothetical protein